MKLSENWLKEWVNPNMTREALVHKLTLAGVGVESCEPYTDPKDPDFIFDFELTPNRADCLSVQGIAREIALVTDSTLNSPELKNVVTLFNPQKKLLSLKIEAPKSCPRYTGAVVKNLLNPNTTSAIFIKIQEKLTKSGMKLIHPIVDVMNYVMLELGQPLHAFDFEQLKSSEIIIRKAKNNEKIILLDQKNITLIDEALVIADGEKPIALAGIMGGLDSAVTDKTQSIFIESAFFSPDAIRGRARMHGLHTDASHRFERGVDPALPLMGLNRAMELLQLIYPDLSVEQMIDIATPEYLPSASNLSLRLKRAEKILGISLSKEKVISLFGKLGFTVLHDFTHQDVITLNAPSYRFDIQEEIDLIEEIARITGYENIPARLNLPHKNPLENHSLQMIQQFKYLLIHQGFQEIITYSFISEKEQQLFDPSETPLFLNNPLSSEYAVMRTNLWAGLIKTVQYHVNRQHNHVRFFEVGTRFKNNLQEKVLSGVWAGKVFSEQWGTQNLEVDFFDLKNILEQIFALSGISTEVKFQPATHPALHPSQTAELRIADHSIGFIGAVHPQCLQQAELKMPLFVFELNLDLLLPLTKHKPVYRDFSRLPTIRRDIALVITPEIQVADIQQLIKQTAGDILSDCFVFDVYQDQKQKDLKDAQKSIALGLIFQSLNHSLSEIEIQTHMNVIFSELKKITGVSLREQ